MKAGFAYIMANQRNGTIYTGSTSNLVQRVYQHRIGMIDGFTKEHGCKLLVWFEAYDDLQRRGSGSCRSRSGTGFGSFDWSRRPIPNGKTSSNH